MTVLRAEGLRKVYQAPRGKSVEAVRNASFELHNGEILGILGPNGAGKTTLLRMIGTIIAPTSGQCWIEDTLAAENPDEVRRRIGFLSGNTKLYGRLTVREVLRYFGRLYSMPDRQIALRTDELAALLGMAPFLDRKCETLSTGQTQKVSIARVLLHDPPILILDEPTLGLDIMSSRTILEFILDARGRGHSIVFSTHYMTEAERLCDRIALIHEGEILAIGSPGELYQRTDTDNLQDAFLSLVGGAQGMTA